MIFNQSIFLETLSEKEEDTTFQDQMQRKILQSKLKGLNNHISNLLQKKVRIDLEIKRTKKKLSKLKKSSQTYVKTRVSLEGFDYDQFTQDDLSLLLESVGEDVFQELLELDEEIEKSQQLLEEIAQLPLSD